MRKLFCVFLLFLYCYGYQSVFYPTQALDGDDGATAWQNIMNATNAPDGNYASAPFTTSNQTSDSITFTNFIITVPDNATITGIEITIVRGVTNADTACDSNVTLVFGGKLISQNFAVCGSNVISQFPPVNSTFGSITGFPGVSLNLTTLSDPSFGFVYQATSIDAIPTVLIDTSFVSIFYTLPNPTTAIATTGIATTAVASTGIATTAVASTGIATTGIATTGIATTAVASTGIASTGIASTTIVNSTIVATSQVTSATNGNIVAVSSPGQHIRYLILVIVIPIGGVLLLILIALTIALAIRTNKYHSMETSMSDMVGTDGTPIQLPPLDETTLLVPIFSLGEHIEKLKESLFTDRNDINGFHLEFNFVEEKSSETENDHAFQGAQSAAHLGKNRYQNVLAPDSTRVKLSVKEDGSDYINANYINGQIPGSEKCYIASQGPVQSILVDFWRMMWETNSCVILMLTKEVENTRLKCDQYWAEADSPLTFDHLKLSLQEISEKDELTIRKLLLENSETSESRVVYQFQYTAWPDHGVPVSTSAFLELAIAAEEANKTSGPILVHCSAGIGRTGTFCVIHSTLKKIELELKENPNEEPKINIAQVVLDLRKQRPNMVQTVEQYEFCYYAIYDGLKQLAKKNEKLANKLKIIKDTKESFIQE